MSNPAVSVIIPVYNHAKSIQSCLHGIFNSTLKDIEVIVVNDGSTDASKKRLEKYGEKIILIHQENRGANPARNRGLQEATGEYVIFVDADVVMRPDMLEKMKSTLDRNAEIDFVYSAFRFSFKLFRGVEFNLDRLKERNYIHTTSMVRRDTFPGFDESIKRLQDWDVWLTMALQGSRGKLIPETLFFVRVDGKSRIGSSWLPRFMYTVPWPILGFTPQAIKNYRQAREVILKKHGLD